MSEQHVQLCPECGKPVGNHYPGAKVYHMPCLEAKFKVLREKWANEDFHSKFNTKGCQSGRFQRKKNNV